jgi:integrase
MALKISFKIRKRLAAKSEEEVVIYFRLADSNRVDITMSTPFTIPFRYWDQKLGCVKDGIMVRDRGTLQRLEYISDNLALLKHMLVEDFYQHGSYAKEYAEKVIEKCLIEIKNRDDEESKKVEQPITDYIDELIKRMKSGMRRVGGETYTLGTIKAWSSFSKLMKEFCADFLESQQRALAWEDFNKDGFFQFLSYMEKMKYLTSSINKYVKDLNATIVAAHEDGVMGDLIIRKHCPRKTIYRYEQPIKVYLTDEELQAIYDMKLEEGSEMCKVRDIFLCGAYTGQRISDYNNLSPDNFKKTPKGYDIVSLVQEKTNNTVVIPVLNENLLTIARKYNFKMPRVVEQVLNRYIKQLCKELSATVPSLAEKYPTVLTMKERQLEADGKVKFEYNEKGEPLRPKYELITSHTARRSCITNLYLQGRFTNQQIMSISGHKDEKTFKGYIVCSGVAIAERIVEINKGSSNEGLFL